MKILVIDVGGTTVKIKATGEAEPRAAPSGPHMGAQQMVGVVQELAHDWAYDAVSLGFPGPVLHGKILCEPVNLGDGWIGFDFEAAFGCPVKIINDAAMQALGSYDNGRMLFLGLGTGLGSAMIVDGLIQSMELAHLPYQNGLTFEDFVGARGLARLGQPAWQQAVLDVMERLKMALSPDYIVIGGGNARLLGQLPSYAHICPNENAFAGGFRLWNEQQNYR